ncbi:TRAP transporter small permease (plasmid) [Thauera butanivorans]|uniref:TRAP transporter small permease n=1 Tax=Thauera butanivorans TaxID=86174 RepID=UPI003AB2B5D8
MFRLLDVLTRAAFYLSAVLLLAITLIYCFEIVSRYFFNSPTVWSTDTVTYFLGAMTCLAIPEVARTNRHIAVTVFVDAMHGKSKEVAQRVLHLTAGVVAGGVAWIALSETLRLYKSGILTLGTIAVPKWWISAFIPLGLALLTLHYLRFAIDPTAAHVPAEQGGE